VPFQLTEFCLHVAKLKFRVKVAEADHLGMKLRVTRFQLAHLCPGRAKCLNRRITPAIRLGHFSARRKGAGD
jgi:hypothetical protein